MSGEIEAFKLIPVALSSPQPINCIQAFGNKLLLGLSNGTLLVYNVRDPFESELSSSLYASYNKFCDRSIDQIGVIRDASYLVVLSDNVIRIHDLETFEQQEVLANTRGATVFAITHGVDELEDGYTCIVSRLVVGSKRKLICFEWRDTEFAEHKEILVPDKIQTVSFVHRERALLGLVSGEYCIANIVSSEIINTSLGGAHAATSAAFAGISYIGIGTRAKALSTSIGNDRAVIIKDSTGYIIDYEGQYFENPTALWDSSLSVDILGYSYPYLLSVLPAKGIEVRNPLTMNVIQNLQLKKIKHISDGKLLYVATSDKVFRVLLTDLEDQVQNLVNQTRLSEAISLVDSIEPVLMTNKINTLRKLKILAATEKFKEQKFEEALSIFSDVSAPPKTVLALFPPTLWSDDLSDNEEELQNSGTGGTPRASSFTSSSPHDDALASFPHLRESEIIVAVRSLQQYLAITRRKISKLRTIHGSVLHDDTCELSRDVYGDLEEAAVLVDTTLLHCYLLVSPALVGPLVRVHNHCDPVVVETALSKAHKWKELIDYYYGKSMHDNALKLLSQLGHSDDTQPDLHGPDATVKYIQKLDCNNIDLILLYAKWPLSVNTLYAEQIFMEDSPESLSLPHSKVFKFLQSVITDTDYQILKRYLEHVIYNLNDKSPNFHNNLLNLYVKDVFQDIPKSSQTLINFIKNSSYYRPERVLIDFPRNDSRFYEPLALLYGKKGDDVQALELYAYRIQDQKKARAYCAELYNEDTNRGLKALETLLSMYLAGSSEKYRSDIIDLLASQGSKMSATDVLVNLPSDTSIKDIDFFLQSQIRNLHSSMNNGQVTSAFLQVNLIRTQEHLMELGQAHSLITYLRICKVCRKRLGYSVISVFPDGEVVHYGCSKQYKDKLVTIEEHSKPLSVHYLREKQKIV